MTKKRSMSKDVGPLTMRIYAAVCRYLSDPHLTENVQIQIDKTDLSVEIADPEQDLPNCDYYPVSELITETDKGSALFLPDDNAISNLTAQYFIN